MTIVCDGQFMDNVIDEFGETIYLRVATITTLSDEYAVENVSWTQYKLKGLMNVYTADSEGVREGTYYTGEITFLIDTDYEDLAVRENKIWYPPDAMWYEINRLRKIRVGDVTYVLEITVDRLGKTPKDTVQVTINSNTRITT